ncbi:acyltransferase family protein [Algoriphagus formosus]|uniref:acyltransferase family protein n=1 Tax=Algoriphagus formosus TaxID=2007308 RepID=UPI0012FD3AFE
MKNKTLKYNPHLDGLRALAFILVFLYHTESSIFPFGWIGVDLFFVLSGFLITRILISSLDSNISLKKYLKVFYTRRILRIFPLYYLTVIFFIIVFPFLSQFFQTSTNHNGLADDLIWFIIYFQNFIIGFRGEYFNPGFLNHFWTLSIEEHFYLFWPFILYFFRKKHF